MCGGWIGALSLTHRGDSRQLPKSACKGNVATKVVATEFSDGGLWKMREGWALKGWRCLEPAVWRRKRIWWQRESSVAEQHSNIRRGHLSNRPGSEHPMEWGELGTKVNSASRANANKGSESRSGTEALVIARQEVIQNSLRLGQWSDLEGMAALRGSLKSKATS